MVVLIFLFLWVWVTYFTQFCLSHHMLCHLHTIPYFLWKLTTPPYHLIDSNFRKNVYTLSCTFCIKNYPFIITSIFHWMFLYVAISMEVNGTLRQVGIPDVAMTSRRCHLSLHHDVDTHTKQYYVWKRLLKFLVYNHKLKDFSFQINQINNRSDNFRPNQ